MGEGMAIGLEEIISGKVFGTEMAGLSGGIKVFHFKTKNYGYQIYFEKTLQVNGMPRENYTPVNYILQTCLSNYETLNEALFVLQNR